MKTIFTTLLSLSFYLTFAQGGIILETSNQIDSTYSSYAKDSPSSVYKNRFDFIYMTKKSISYRLPIFTFDSLKLESADPTTFAWLDGSKKLRYSNKSALTLTKAQITDFPSGVTGLYGILTIANGIVTGGKRQEPLSGTTNASGVVTFTFSSAFSVAPNVSAPNLGVGTTNKETIILTALSTTSATFKVEARTDVLGLLPSYSNVNGRAVDCLFTEK